MSDSLAQLSEVARGIGRPGFGPALMTALDAVLGADMCSAFAVTDRPDLILAQSRNPAHSAFASIASLRYARRYWNRDTPMLANLGRAHRNVLVTRRAGRSIRDYDYRVECYGEGDVSERLSVLSSGQTPALILNAYRVGEREGFGAAELDRIEGLAPLLMAMLARHAELTRNAPAQDAGALADRLRCATPELSLREAQVLAAIATGATEEEAAERLGVGVASIATYRKRGYAKAGLSGRRALRDMVAGLD